MTSARGGAGLPSRPVAGSTQPSRPIAIVIVTYNSAEVIADCLRALPAALEGAGESRIIVVDNASQDGTADVVALTDNEVKVVHRTGNDGFAAGVNTGFAHADGCDVLVLNADIRLAPGAVKALRAAVQPGVGVVAPKLTEPDGSIQHSLRRTPTVLRTLGEAVLGGRRAGRFGPLGETVTKPAAYERAGFVDWATGAAWLVTRECIEAIGPIEERYLLYSEETEFMLRAGAKGFKTYYEPAARAVHLGGESGTSPRLWSLLVTNKVRLHRERHGKVAAAGMWAASLLNSLPRAARGSATHKAAVKALLTQRAWPAPLSAPAKPSKDAPPYVCFSAQDWWYHNQAHSDFQLMRRVAEHRKVLLVNSIGLRMPTPGKSTQFVRRILRKAGSVAKLVRRPLPDVPGYYVMTPLPLPFYGSERVRALGAKLVRAQVRAVCAVLRMPNPIVVATIPTAWDVVQGFEHRRLVFNRSDRHSAFPEADQSTIAALEDKLLAGSDHVLYVSRQLQGEESGLTQDRAHFLDHGVDLQHFRRRAELPADIASIPGPRIGFFGSLDDYLVDFDLLERLAQEFPEASLVLIGDATLSMERFAKYPNVHWLDFRPYAQIPAYGTGFDVAIMPWLDNDWIKHANPIKMKEYLALGLAVVSTDFPEVHQYPELIRIAQGHDAFVAAVRQTLTDGGLSTVEGRREAVLPASWDSRARQLMDLAEGQR
ncbi:glycosyltransferase [Actinokineospora terrae]|uniref:Glycosyltransferase, GT2 family n=1 Tax=Actinokineospora terrae TaxID=155974 RepID=A0A1H9VTP1_9PSEU|nr:glycosyltransferase [Actinokineospora terrae]SES25190.1 Glycosyltransferase, GT2 family [Actinokineospora terrae]